MSAIHGYINGIGVTGPGLNDWVSTADILAGERAYQPAATRISTPEALPAAERRRVGRVVKLALSTGLQALNGAGSDMQQLATVFSSSGADGETCHAICTALATSAREVSPTHFHNSVHNVAAGYWGIATRAMAPSTALCAFDASFSAGLLEAMLQVHDSKAPVLLIAYDADYPSPIKEERPIADAFAVALLIAPGPSVTSYASIGIEREPSSCAKMADAALEKMRVSIPAARSLPLLQMLARKSAGSCIIEYLPPEGLLIQVDPC